MDQSSFNLYWDQLRQVVVTLLTLKPGDYPPISYELTYSAVYKCVCQGYAPQLYQQLLDEVRHQLENVACRFECLSEDEFSCRFNDVWQAYCNAVGSIVPVFNYMNRFYVEAKLNKNLKTVLFMLFDAVLLQRYLNRLLTILSSCSQKPLLLHPSLVESLVKAIHTLRPECSDQYPELFRRFIPGLVPLTHAEMLPQLVEESKQMCYQLQAAASPHETDRGLKRRMREESPGLKSFAPNSGDLDELPAL